jgi:predicted dehydrogenase
MQRTKIGLVGCGAISGIYLTANRRFDILEIAACADLDLERARARAAEYDVPRACTVAELLADPEIEIVVNLTIPKAHAEVALAAIMAGKSVYNEKPLAISREDGQRILAAAAERGVRVGCAPDTFLGAGLQTCRQLIDDGAIGRPVAATAFMVSPGHESWHPDPDFYYQPGGGPMFDMGPYYLTALVSMLGPVRRVTGSTQVTYPTRTITSQPKYGQTITVNTPTHVAGVLDFASGAVGTIITSFDVWGSNLPLLEIYGTEGSLSLPDPNGFGGPVRVRKARTSNWEEVPLSHGYSDNNRGIGVADMAYGLRSGRPHRANGKLAYHVLDLMHAFHDASREDRHVMIESSCERPAPLPRDLPPRELDS